MCKRYWEMDAIRWFALFSMLSYHVAACMVIFHMLIEDEAFFSIYNTIWLTSGAFVFISGTALVLRYARKNGDLRAYHISIMKKALFLFAIAMGITCISCMVDFMLFDETGRFIKFGFMHMLSISMFIYIPFLKLGRWNIIPGIAVILIGILAVPILQYPEWLYPLGLHSADFMDGLHPGLFPALPLVLVDAAWDRDWIYPVSKRHPQRGPSGNWSVRQSFCCDLHLLTGSGYI